MFPEWFNTLSVCVQWIVNLSILQRKWCWWGQAPVILVHEGDDVGPAWLNAMSSNGCTSRTWDARYIMDMILRIGESDPNPCYFGKPTGWIAWTTLNTNLRYRFMFLEQNPPGGLPGPLLGRPILCGAWLAGWPGATLGRSHCWAAWTFKRF